MKIDSIELYHIRLKLKNPFVTSFGRIEERDTLLVRVKSGKHEGWGEAAHLSLPLYTDEYLEGGKRLLAEHLLPRFIGKDLSSPEEVPLLYRDIRGNNISKAGVEMAIWDLFARKAGMPLNRYIGAKRNSSPVGISIGIQDSTEDMLRRVKDAVEYGYKRIKIKIKPGADLDIVRSIRERYPELKLMADANSAYRLSDLGMLKRLDQYNLMMIEQPLGDDDIVDHSRLQKDMKTPICLDESIHSYDDARKAIELGSCRIINIKPGRVGGLGETLRIHALCLEKGLPVWVGGMLESGVGKAYLDHISTLDGFTLPGDNSPQSRYFVEDIIKKDSEFVRGMVKLSDLPGIGIQVDEKRLKEHTVEKIVIG